MDLLSCLKSAGSIGKDLVIALNEYRKGNKRKAKEILRGLSAKGTKFGSKCSKVVDEILIG